MIMSNIKTIALLILVLTCVGCGIRKVETSVIEKKSDTLIVKTQKVVAPSLSDVLILDNICDTITNTVMRFQKIFVQDNDSIQVLTNANNQLIIQNKRLQRVLFQNDSIISTKSNDVLKSSHVTKYRTNWNWVALSFLIGFGLALFKPWKMLKF